jgi:hypothetical protein
MPWRRFAASPAGEAMNASSSRAASGCVEASQTPPENVVTIWTAGGSGYLDTRIKNMVELCVAVKPTDSHCCNDSQFSS